MRASDERLAELIDLIYDATLHPETWNDVSRELELQTRGRVAFLLQDQRPVGFFKACSKAAPIDVDEYLDRHWRSDLAMERLRGAPVGAAVADSRLVTEDGRDRLSFYRDYLRPRGLHRGYYTVVAREGGQAVVMGVHRPDKNDEFTEDCVRFLDRLRPHLARGVALNRRLKAAETQRDASASALELSGVGLVLAAADGSFRFANGLAEEHLRRGLLTVRDGRCVAATPAQTRDLHLALARAARRTGGLSTGLTLGSEGAAIRITVAPLRPEGPAGLGGEPVAMILLSPIAPTLDAGQLKRCYGLTDAEARLLGALAGGERLADYAERMGVRLTTAKTHLSSLFLKTGEQRQADLIRLALSDPALRCAA